MTTGKAMSKKRIVEIAKAILSGEADPIEGCRALVRAGRDLDENERHDPDFVTIVAIESETDAFPGVEARCHWEAEALAKRDRERAAYVDRNRQWMLEACRGIVRKFAGP